MKDSHTVKPRILFVAPSAYTLSGLANWLDYLDPGLRSLGWSVTVGLVSGPRFHLPEKYLNKHPHDSWLEIPCKTLTMEGRRRAVSKVLLKTDPDLVVSVNIPDVYSTVHWMRSKAEKTPKVVMSNHGILADISDDALLYSQVIDAVISTNRLAQQIISNFAVFEPERNLYAPCGADPSGLKRNQQSNMPFITLY